MAPAPMRIHQDIAVELIYVMKSSLQESSCPECHISFENDWKISDETVVRPDIVLVCNDHNKKYLTKAPKIIIEILSPSTAHKDETLKFKLYEAEKVDYYILVYPGDLRAKAYRLKEDHYTKIGDFTNETLTFDTLQCELKIDFQKVFARFH
jgi:Uma2 family endonuclease